MNEIIVNRTDRRTDKPKRNPFFNRESDYSISSPKTPRMQEHHKKMEKELLKTPKIKKASYDDKQIQMGIEIELEHTDDRNEAERIAKDHLDEFPDYYTRLITMEDEAKKEMEVTAEEIADDVKPTLQNLEQLISLINQVGEKIEDINNNYATSHASDVGKGEWYEFNIKIGVIFNDWMDEHIIGEEIYGDACLQELEGFVENLKTQYSWIGEWGQTGRSGGHLVISDKEGFVSDADKWYQYMPTSLEDFDGRSSYYNNEWRQEEVNDEIKTAKEHIGKLDKLESDLIEIENKVKESKSNLEEQMKTKEYWRGMGMDIPNDEEEQQSEKNREFEERWNKRASLRKRAEDTPKCPQCGTELEDVGNYKWDCPNDCFPVALELGQMQDEDNEEVNEKDGYIDYIENTLMPDLMVAMHDETVKDLRKLVAILKGEIDNSDEISEFIEYLEGALIPDLKESRNTATAQDFEKGIKLIKNIDGKQDKRNREFEERWSKRASLNKKAETTYYYGNKKEDLPETRSTRYTVYKVDHEGRYDADAELKAKIKAEENGDTLAGGFMSEIGEQNYREYNVIDANDITVEQLQQRKVRDEEADVESKRTQYHHQGQNPIAVYDESDYMESEIEDLMGGGILEEYANYILDGVNGAQDIAQKVSDSQEFWKLIDEAGLRDELEEKIKDSVYSNTDQLNDYAEWFLESFNEALKKYNKSNQWHISGRNMGWQRSSGEVDIEADIEVKDAQDFISKVFPRTSDYTARIWEHKFDELGVIGMLITVSHHDGSDSYYCVPHDPAMPKDKTKGELFEERWSKKADLMVIIEDTNAPKKAIDRLVPIPNLWYENEEGKKIFPDLHDGLPDDYMRKGYPYQHSRFPVLRDSICTDEGQICSGETTINCVDDIVIYLVTRRKWRLGDAITVAATGCERCINILIEDATGEIYKDRDKAGTHCELCAIIDPDYDLHYNHVDGGTFEPEVCEEQPPLMCKDSSVKWKAIKLAFKFTKAKDRYEEFQNNTYIIFTSDAKFKMEDLDAMGEIKENMIGKIKKVNDDSLLIEIGRQVYEIPLVEAFKVMKPFRATVVTENEISENTPQEGVETIPSEESGQEIMPEDTLEEEQPEAKPVRPGLSMEREPFQAVPIRIPQKPLEKALSVETLLKRMWRKIAVKQTQTEYEAGTKIQVDIDGERLSGEILQKRNNDYQIQLSDGRRLVIPSSYIVSETGSPKEQVSEPTDTDNEMPKWSEVWVGGEGFVGGKMSKGTVVEIDGDKYTVELVGGKTVKIDKKYLRLDSLPDSKRKLKFKPYRYSKSGLYPAFDTDKIAQGTLLYAEINGFPIILGTVTGEKKGKIAVDLIDREGDVLFAKDKIFLIDLPTERKESMRRKHELWEQR